MGCPAGPSRASAAQDLAKALSDGAQSLPFGVFGDMLKKLE